MLFVAVLLFRLPSIKHFYLSFAPRAQPCLLFFSIEPVEYLNCEILLTTSLDCTVRLWTMEGHFIGESLFDNCLPFFLNFIQPQCNRWREGGGGGVN